MKVYTVIELVHEPGDDKVIAGTWAFSLEWQAVAFVESRFAETSERLENAVGLFNADHDSKGWFNIIDNNDGMVECWTRAIEVDKEA